VISRGILICRWPLFPRIRHNTLRMHQNIEAAIAFVFNKDQFLILKRMSWQFAGSTWGLVGGKPEAGESPEAALRRELLEEIGVDTDEHRVVELGVHLLHYPERDWNVAVYRVELSQEINIQPNAEEFVAVEWINVDDCMKREDTMEGLQQLLSTLGETLKSA